MRRAIANGENPPQAVKDYVQQAEALQALTEQDFPNSLQNLASAYPKLWQLWQQQNCIGLVYGGATKIKQYVFDAAKLPDVRGASALLDRINLVDLPAFFQGETSSRFEQCQRANKNDRYCEKIRTEWLKAKHPQLSEALIPELIVYSTGGNILAFCPAAFVDHLSNAIEKRYTEETLTANSCAVGATFRLLELRLGLLQNPIEKTFWLDQLKTHKTNPAVCAYPLMQRLVLHSYQGSGNGNGATATLTSMTAIKPSSPEGSSTHQPTDNRILKQFPSSNDTFGMLKPPQFTLLRSR